MIALARVDTCADTRASMAYSGKNKVSSASWSEQDGCAHSSGCLFGVRFFSQIPTVGAFFEQQKVSIVTVNPT